MVYDPRRHQRRSIRLQGYDYAQAGAYFVTIGTKDGASLFGACRGDEVHLTAAGRMITEEWDALPARFPAVELDAFVVMPNHVHGIIVLCEPASEEGAATRAARTGGPRGRPNAEAPGSEARTGGPCGRPNAEGPAKEARTGGPCGRPNAGNAAEPDLAIEGKGAATRAARTSHGGRLVAARTSLGDVVGAYKSLTTVRYTRGVRESGWPAFAGRVWHRNYYEHIIRNEDSLNRIRQYIADNPERWAFDRENPEAVARRDEDWRR